METKILKLESSETVSISEDQCVALDPGENRSTILLKECSLEAAGSLCKKKSMNSLLSEENQFAFSNTYFIAFRMI